MSNKAEEILIELLNKLKDDVIEMNGYICAEEGHSGYADDRAYAEVDINTKHIEWIEERIEIKKSLIIKETK